jgi:hypothetical protein
MFLKLFVLLISSILLCNGQRRESLDDRIRQVFTGNRGTFDTIVTPEPPAGQRGTFDLVVTPEPVVNPTQSPQFISSGNGDACKCVPYWNCKNPPRVDNSENRFFGEIDVRYNPESCQDVLDVCCPSSSESSVPVTPPPPLNQKTTQSPFNPPPPPITGPPAIQSKCGVRNVDGIDFKLIGNGNEAGFAEFPWMVIFII